MRSLILLAGLLVLTACEDEYHEYTVSVYTVEVYDQDGTLVHTHKDMRNGPEAVASTPTTEGFWRVADKQYPLTQRFRTYVSDARHIRMKKNQMYG